MPLTTKGKKIKAAMREQYGKDRGDRVFYAAENKGSIKGVAKKAKGGETKSRVNEAGNYTKPTMRKKLFEEIKAGGKGGKPGQWSGRKAQMLAKRYKAKGGSYTS